MLASCALLIDPGGRNTSGTGERVGRQFWRYVHEGAQVPSPELRRSRHDRTVSRSFAGTEGL